MSVVDVLGLLGLLAGAAAVLATLTVKGKDKAIAASWKELSEASARRAEEAKIRAAEVEAENEKLQIRVKHLEQQVKVLVDTITAKDSIDALAREMDFRFNELQALVVEAIVTSGVPRKPASERDH